MSFYGKQGSLQAFPLRPEHSGVEILHWQSGEMERLVFSKTYISSSLIFIRNKVLNHSFLWSIPLICCTVHRVCCDSLFWCQVRMPPITSAHLPNLTYQFCQYHHFSQICPSWERRLTAMWSPMVTCILQDIWYNMCVPVHVCLLFWLSACLCVLITNFQKHRSECQWGWSGRAQSCYKASCGSTRLGKASTSVMVQCGSPCWRVRIHLFNHPILSKFLLSLSWKFDKILPILIYSDHKRLDYVLEHQVLTTSSETHDVEVPFYFVYIIFTYIWGLTHPQEWQDDYNNTK